MRGRDWLQRAATLAEKDYSTWTRPEHKAGTTGLARYYDYGSGPELPEMADDSTYYPDVIRWLEAHPKAVFAGEPGTAYLMKGPEHPNDAEAARLKRVELLT